MEMRSEGPVKTRREGAILEVTLDAPKANAISLKTSRVMGLVFRDFRDDDSLRSCIVKAAGEKCFCPGWDRKAAAEGEAVVRPIITRITGEPEIALAAPGCQSAAIWRH